MRRKTKTDIVFFGGDAAMLSLAQKVLERIRDLFHLFICMVLSEYLLFNIVFGGALYLMGQVWLVFSRLYGKRYIAALPPSLKAQGVGIFIVSVLLNIALLIVYPSIAKSTNFILLLLLVLLSFVRQFSAAFVAGWKLSSRIVKAAFLFAVHAAFTAVLLFLLSGHVEHAQLITVAWLLGALSILSSLLESLLPPPSPEPPAEVPEGTLLEATSYRIYNRMTANVMIALNLSLLAYVCYLRFQPLQPPLQSFLSMCAWMMFLGGFTALCYAFLTRKVVTKYDKPSLFAFGGVLWTLATVISYNRILGSGPLESILTNALWGSGLAAMLAIIISLGRDIKAVVELGLAPAAAKAYERNTSVMIEWSLLLSTMLMLAMFTVSSFLVDGKLDRMDAMLGMQDFMRTVMMLLPMAFVLAALLYALMQPLDRNVANKIKLYAEQFSKGLPNPLLKRSLQKQLLNTSKRVSYRLLRIFLRPFMPCKVIGRELVDVSRGPVIFVCNHLEVYGPMITNLYMPFYFRPWIISQMLDPNDVEEHLRPGVNRVFRFLSEKARARLCRRFAPLMKHIMDATDPIPVYRQSGRGIIKTMRLSVDAMESEDNILLFPENSTAEGEPGVYRESGASAFYTGFCTLAEMYYKRTGKATVFYPVYANKKRRTLTFGPGLAYDPNNERNLEKRRIAETLHEWMNDQGENA
ncbi:MAG: hypothetical protein AAGU74_09385 [Bacillota bacterium]